MIQFNSRWFVLAGTVIILLLLSYGVFWMPNSYPGDNPKIVTIPRGSSFKAALDSLESTGAIRSRFTFKIAGRLLGYTREIKVGKYLFASGLSNLDILRDMKEGKSRMIIGVSIPEGWRMEMIARKFARDLGVDSARILTRCRDSAFVRRLGIDAKNLEGYLLPETYNFYWQTDEQEIVERMITSFRNFYVDSLKKRAEELHLTTRELLALASIVEGESGVDAERPMIAGVYWNRLKKNMRLEADPTIQYVIPNGPRRLLYADLKYDSPYNTYLNYGLPPGPINNPGKASILATLYPENHEYLYFVATGVGGHRFSRTYSEHQKAIKVFKRVRRDLQRQVNGAG
ncbi:MAG: endolytic transglycosylase MltG [Bacteroidota bacterium]